MKNKFWALLLAALLAGSVGLALLLAPREGGVQAQILSDGTLVRTVDLRTDQQFTVTTPQGGRNVVTVRDGRLAVTEASCPDHICMDMGFRSSGQIVCLPNRLVIRFLGDTSADAVTG